MVTFGGPGFKPEPSQHFLPKWSRIPNVSLPEFVSEVQTRLDRRTLNDALRHVELEPDDGREVPDIDMFATTENRLFPKHCEGSSDSNGAFDMNWGVCRLGFIHAPSEYMPKVVDKVIRDAGQSMVVYVAGWKRDAWMKKLRLTTLKEYRVPKGGPGLMSGSGINIVTPKLRIALVDGSLFHYQEIGQRTILKVGGRTWDIGNRGIEDVGIIDEHECVRIGADDPFVAECQRQLEKRYAPIRSLIKAESGDVPDPAQRLLDKILHDYKDWSLSEKTVANPPVCGPYGDCTFSIIHNTPKKQRPFPLIGEREDALRDLIQEFIDRGWVEPSNSK